jgi:DNA replication protein DnaC
MRTATGSITDAAIRQWAKRLHLPTLAGECTRLAEQATKEQWDYLSYLEALLEAEVDERDRHVVERRLKEAHLPKVKTLEEFDFQTAAHLPPARLRKLAEGEYVARMEPVILLGETGTGKTHLATALAVAACRQRRRVRFTTMADLVTELIESKERNELGRVVGRWSRYELIVLDEWGYVAMKEAAVELLFQVISARAERAAVIVTTNLPFSEWSTMFPNARLCKAMIDRLTDQAHIIETGTESYRLMRTLARQKKGKGDLR